MSELGGQRQWSTAGEAVLWKMPPLQVVLTELPTEQHLAPPVQRGKVDQPAIGVSKDDSLLLELLESLLDVERHCRLPGIFGRGAGRGGGGSVDAESSVGAAGVGLWAGPAGRGAPGSVACPLPFADTARCEARRITPSRSRSRGRYSRASSTVQYRTG